MGRQARSQAGRPQRQLSDEVLRDTHRLEPAHAQDAGGEPRRVDACCRQHVTHGADIESHERCPGHGDAED
eukprot:2918111-Lingulodinium_polyedra.AAC.1